MQTQQSVNGAEEFFYNEDETARLESDHKSCILLLLHTHTHTLRPLKLISL